MGSYYFIGTNAIAIHNLLNSKEWNVYVAHIPNNSGKELLKTISENILLDVGALMMDENKRWC